MYSAQQGFEEMDRLSGSGTPFFFMVNYAMDGIEAIPLPELENHNIFVDFQHFTNAKMPQGFIPNFSIKALPLPFNIYSEGFNLIQDHLKKGDSYLANYTCKTQVMMDLALGEIFRHAKAEYKILYKEKFVCFSPENFIKIIDNQVITHPMKGTVEATLPNASEILLADAKEAAEHATVVDLLRNDLSIIAKEVAVEEYRVAKEIPTQDKTLIATVSKISGQLKPDLVGRVGSIMKSILPAGSICGAPKSKTLEIISKAENYKRDWYTGVCGVFDGKNLDSCVMIRFVERDPSGRLWYKSGGGITHQSDPLAEYNEMNAKIYVPIF